MTDSCLRVILLTLLHKLSFKFGSLFLVSLFQSSCPTVSMYVFTLDLRSHQQTSEQTAKLDDKAIFASLSALLFPVMPTCEEISVYSCLVR